MEICTVTLGKDWIAGWSCVKNNGVSTKEVITTAFKFQFPLTCIVLFIWVICPVGWRVQSPQWLFIGGEFWEQCHSAAPCQVPNLLLLRWRAGTRQRLSCGRSVNFREGRPIKCWDFFPYFYQEIIPWTGSEINQSHIINGSRCSDLDDQKYFLQMCILFSCITGLCLWEGVFFFSYYKIEKGELLPSKYWIYRPESFKSQREKLSALTRKSFMKRLALASQKQYFLPQNLDLHLLPPDTS